MEFAFSSRIFCLDIHSTIVSTSIASAKIAAPNTTASSGLMLNFNFLLPNFISKIFLIAGSLVDPPTNIWKENKMKHLNIVKFTIWKAKTRSEIMILGQSLLFTCYFSCSSILKINVHRFGTVHVTDWIVILPRNRYHLFEVLAYLMHCQLVRSFLSRAPRIVH